MLAELLQAAPTLRAAWVDDQGVPVSVSRRVQRPGRDDPGAVREALLRIAAEPPGPTQPRHPDDHPPRNGHPPLEVGHDLQEEASARDDRAPTSTASGGAGAAGRDGPPAHRSSPWQPEGPSLLDRPHPTGTPGPYRVPTRLRRLVTLRSPRCEWPGCGCSAASCDLDHDLAWPFGATCSCQLGPLCRRHHRVKQQIMTKQRTRHAGVRWTGPTGRSWLSPQRHRPPATPARPLPAVPIPDELDQLGSAARDTEQWHTDPTDPRWDDPDGTELRATDHDAHPAGPPDVGRTRWTLDLDDPYAWSPTG